MLLTLSLRFFPGKQFKCTVCDYTAAQKPHLLRHMEQHASFKVRAREVGGRGNSDWTHATFAIAFAFQPFSCHVWSLFCAPPPLFRSIVVPYGLETSSRNGVQEDANRRQSMHLPLKTGVNWEEITGSGRVSMPSDFGVLQVHCLVKQV